MKVISRLDIKPGGTVTSSYAMSPGDGAVKHRTLAFSLQRSLLAVLMWERPGKFVMCSDIPGRWADVWKSGTFLLYSCEAAF